MYLVQILLPLADNGERPFAREEYEKVENELLARWGGFTAYRRSPASGLWQKAASEVEHDELVIYEVMTDSLPLDWWRSYREQLELRFRQDSLVVHAQTVELI